MASQATIRSQLDELFSAEREVRRLHDELAMKPQDALLDGLVSALSEANRLPEEDEAALRLVRIASLLGEFDGPRVIDALIDILAAEIPEARRAAGEELEHLAFSRFKEVAQGVERALKRLPIGSPALPELPYLLAEIPEPSIPKLLGMFLAHEDADAVAAAIEALVETGDPKGIMLIAPLASDQRTVELAGEDDATEEITIGELAQEALDLLSESEEQDEEG